MAKMQAGLRHHHKQQNIPLKPSSFQTGGVYAYRLALLVPVLESPSAEEYRSQHVREQLG